MGQTSEAESRPRWHPAVSNFGWLVVERGVRFVLGALVGFWVARYLGPHGLGVLSYCLALVTLVGFVPALGLDAVVKRELLNAPDAAGEVLASAFLLRLAAGAATCLGLWLVSASGFGFNLEEAQVMRVLTVLLFQPAFGLPELWLQAHLRAKHVVLVQLAALGVASAVRIVLVLHGASVVAFAWVLAGEMTLGMAGLWVMAGRGGLTWPLHAARRGAMAKLMTEAWPLMFASLAIVVYMKIDEVMLRQMAGTTVVGIYAAAARLSEVWYFLPTALASSILPALLRARREHPDAYRRTQQRYYDGSAAAAYLLSVPIALASPWIVRLAYGPAFAAAAPILAVHIWSSIFVFLGVARGQWLVNEGLQGFYLVATLCGAVSNVLLNLWFIPRWGGLGAAYATVVSYGVAAWGASYFHPRVRVTAVMQTRALLIPLRGWRYLRRP